MKSRSLFFRAVAVTVLSVFLQSIILPGLTPALASDCDYDPSSPSVEHARTAFKMFNYKCAEEELLTFLAYDDADIEDKASAHVLLASVYYAMLKNNTEKRDRVMEQFVEAFKSYREWRGELDIKSSEFLDLMEMAKAQVDEAKIEEDKKPVEEPVVEEKPADTTETAIVVPPPPEKKKKPWYTQWWAIGAGVGLVAVAVVALGGGGDDDADQPPSELPDFPGTPPPSGK